MSKYEITKEERAEWLPKIKEWLETDHAESPTEPELDLKGLSPFKAEKFLEELGYDRDNAEHDCNGWQWDFWTTYRCYDKSWNLILEGTGHTFTLNLRKDYSH